jgi:hypothetical protein
LNNDSNWRATPNLARNLTLHFTLMESKREAHYVMANYHVNALLIVALENI